MMGIKTYESQKRGEGRDGNLRFHDMMPPKLLQISPLRHDAEANQTLSFDDELTES